jgi:hypothetical protein
MLAFDTVTLIWDGTSASGAPVHYEVDRQISTVAPLTVVVPQAEILKFLDGHVDVYYRVVPFSARGKTFARALATVSRRGCPCVSGMSVSSNRCPRRAWTKW